MKETLGFLKKKCFASQTICKSMLCVRGSCASCRSRGKSLESGWLPTFTGIWVLTRLFLASASLRQHPGLSFCVGNFIEFYLKLIWSHHARNVCNSWPFFRVYFLCLSCSNTACSFSPPPFTPPPPLHIAVLLTFPTVPFRTGAINTGSNVDFRERTDGP